MREWMACLMLVAACSGQGDDAVPPPRSDAGGPDATPGPIDGQWALAWTCSAGCPTNPGLYEHLLAEGLRLTYGNDDGTSMQDAGIRIEGDCMDVAGRVTGSTLRRAYRICNFDGTAMATITWEIGAAVTTWDLTGTR